MEPTQLNPTPDVIADPADARTDLNARFRSLVAPTDSFGTMIDPPLRDAELLLKQNLNTASADDATWSWSTLRRDARTQLLADARRYTQTYRDVDPSLTHRAADQPIVMAGHQPALFHPGVWFKNFALSRLGAGCDAVAINLIVDNDVGGPRSIRVPGTDLTGRAGWQSVAYDSGGGGVPYEQTEIRDADCFASFDRRVAAAISPLVDDPLVGRLWHHARGAIGRCGIAGCALAQARHALEAELGWQTLEIPLGVAVRGLPFAQFVVGILNQIERFVDVYNDSAAQYRQHHGIRSSAHPVPNLGRQDGWIETPLWLYGNDRPQRRGVWVRRDGDRWLLSDLQHRQVSLSATKPDAAAEQLAEAASPDFKLRPRALMTTMFARLVLSDLFLHGIGGGKYDQLADQIIRRFFGISPPGFQVVSGTVRLPGIQSDPDLGLAIAGLQNVVRRTLFHGERWIADDDPKAAALVQRKRDLLAQLPSGTSSGDAHWHREITSINEALAGQLVHVRHALQRKIAEKRFAATNESILGSREHSFCLFPIDYLRESFERMI